MVRLFALPLTLALLAAGAGVYAAQTPLAGRGAPAADFPAAARPVAPIVSPTWGDAGQRDQAKEVFQLAGYLHLHPSDTVADIGAGQGYDTVRLAKLLFRGRVIAEDVDPSALQTLQAEAQRRQLTNVTVALGEPQDPRLPPRSLDAAILVHMYHEIAHPYAFLYNLSAAMKPGAKVGVEELNRPTAAHGTPPALLQCEFAAVGYRLVETRALAGNLGYLDVFAAPGAPPAPQRIRACHA
jgi:SAM-dependent methyltransferase